MPSPVFRLKLIQSCIKWLKTQAQLVQAVTRLPRKMKQLQALRFPYKQKLALKGLRANRCTIAPQFLRNDLFLE